VFRRLCESEAAEFTVAFGDARPSDSLQTVADTSAVRARRLRNRYILTMRGGGSLRWQSGALGPILRREVDAVVAEGDLHCLSTLVAFGMCRLRRIPFIIWWHGVGQQSLRWLNPLRLAWARRASALIFYDSERPRWFVERGVPLEKVFVAWNSVDTDRISTLAAPWSRDRRRILYTGRLLPSKKIGLLLRAFASAQRRLPEGSVLTIVGDGPDAEVLKDLAKTLGVTDATEFAGSVVDERELAPFFNTSMLSVSPGAVGLALIHSMAYGVPMLVADGEPHGPEIAALDDGVNSLLFPPGDVEALASALIRTSRDTHRLAAMSEAARSTVASRYSIAAMARVFESAVDYSSQLGRG
jgi:glycosyltransferase involved in cell wall biosynthesis